MGIDDDLAVLVKEGLAELRHETEALHQRFVRLEDATRALEKAVASAEARVSSAEERAAATEALWDEHFADCLTLATRLDLTQSNQDLIARAMVAVGRAITGGEDKEMGDAFHDLVERLRRRLEVV